MADEKKQDQSQVPTEEVNKRIKPAMAIIKQLFSHLDSLREKEASEKATKDAVELAQQNAEAIMEQPKEIYVSLDGDNIGNAVARAEEKDDERTLSEISSRINAGQEVLKQWALGHGGKLIEAGGDEGLVKVPSHAKDRIEELRQQYRRVVGATATVGVGAKISESTKARMLGKLRGKNQIVFWEPQLQKELDIRGKEEGGEAKKIKTAGLLEPHPDTEPKKEESEQPKEQSKKAPEKPHEDLVPLDEKEKEEDEDEENWGQNPDELVAPEEEEEDRIPHFSKFPSAFIDEALSRGMEPHTYARLLRSYGHDV